MSIPEPDYAVMDGIWNPSTRSWSGRWHMHKSPDIKCDFTYSPKVESPPQNVLCEKCHKPGSETDRMHGCWSCEAAAHVKCANTPFTCAKCLAVTNSYGSVPPLSRNWLGHFFIYTATGVKPVPVEDKFQLKFDYSPYHSNDLSSKLMQSDATLAKIQGTGSNHYGEFSVSGFLKAGHNGAGISYRIEIFKRFTSDLVRAQQPVATPSSIDHSLSRSSALRPRGRTLDDDIVHVDDDDDILPDRKRNRWSGSRIKKPVSFVTCFFAEKEHAEKDYINAASLISLWKSVSAYSPNQLNITCLTSTASHLPLRAIVSTSSPEGIQRAISSPSIVASISTACQAVDSAIENQRFSMSAGSIEKSEYIFPAGIAAVYAAEKLGKKISVLDLCSNNKLTRSLQGVNGIGSVSSVRDATDPRQWKEGLMSCVKSMRQQTHDFLIVSLSLSLRGLDYAWAIEHISHLNCPMVVVLEELSSHSPEHAKVILDVMIKLNDETSTSPAPSPSLYNPTTTAARPPAQQPTILKTATPTQRVIPPVVQPPPPQTFMTSKPQPSPPANNPIRVQSNQTPTMVSNNGKPANAPPSMPYIPASNPLKNGTNAQPNVVRTAPNPVLSRPQPPPTEIHKTIPQVQAAPPVRSAEPPPVKIEPDFEPMPFNRDDDKNDQDISMLDDSSTNNPWDSPRDSSIKFDYMTVGYDS